MNPFSRSILTTLKPSQDKRSRPQGEEWIGIIIHHTGVSNRKIESISKSLWHQLNENIGKWIQKEDQVSAHFLIGREGELTQFVDPRFDLAYHAGSSSYYHPQKRQVVENWNKFAIGIELLGDGNLGKYSDQQYDTLISLCRELLEAFPMIDPRCITGHENIAPLRKVDPGIYFDWRRLFEGIYSREINTEVLR